MSLGQGLQRSAAFRSNADLDLDAFRALCEQEVDPGLVPSASAIVQRVPVYDAAAGTAAGVGYLAGGIGPQGTSVDSVVALSENP